MNKDNEYTELTAQDTMKRLDYLIQLDEDQRVNNEEVSSFTRKQKRAIRLHVGVSDFAPIVVSRTKAREIIRDTFRSMADGAQRTVDGGNFLTAIPTMTLDLTDYGTLWMSASVKRTPTPELQAKWDAVNETREQVFGRVSA